MNYTIRVILIVLLIFIVVGFARGWFFITSNQENATDRVNVNLTIDSDKMKSDANRVGEAASDLTGKASKKTEPSESDLPESQPQPDPVSDQDSAFPARPVSPEVAK